MTLLSRGMLAAGLMALASPALAQNALPDDAPSNVAEVVVTAPNLEETLPHILSDYGSELSVTTNETISEKIYIDLNQALQMETPGLYLVPRNGPFSYVDIALQGSRTGDVLWLIDGVRINNRLYTGTSPADTLPASMIERIEVLKGGQSLFYGTQAAAGVINVVTRSFSDTPDGSFTIGGDTNDGVHADALFRDGFGPHQVVLWASKDEAEGYDTYTVSQPSATAKKRGYNVFSAGAKYGLDISEDLRLTLSYQHTDAHLDYPGARLTRLSFNDRDEDILTAKLDWTPSEQAQVFLKAYLHDWDSVYSTVNNVPGQPGQTVTLDDSTYWGYLDQGVSLMARLRPHRGFEYELGYDFQTYEGRDDVLLIAQQSETVHAFIGQVRTTDELFETVRLAAGLRHDQTGGAEKTVWNVSGRWEPSETLFLEGTAGTSFILPSAEQLFGIDPCCAVGNPDLQPEESLNLNVAIGGTQGPVQWRLTGFGRRIEDLIVDVYDRPDFPDGIYSNVDGEVKTIGGEALVTATLAEDLVGRLSYTYTRTRAEGSNQQFDRIPEQFAKGSLAWDPESRPFGASATALWTGDVFSTVAGFGRVNHGDYLVVDLAAYVFLDGADRRHRLTGRLENAFDEDYVSRVGSGLIDLSTQRFLFEARGVPRTLRVSYTYDF